ncbi:MAG: hypothetical protein Q9171_004077 [Xanthocarpia ochracea]
MGRKRRSAHNTKRAQCGRPSKRNHKVKQRIHFMDLPQEIRDAIVEDLTLGELATLVRTSKSVQASLEPRLYYKIYMRFNTPNNTAGLVELLQRRHHIAPMIQILVLDEYHPRHTRRLLSIEMPNLGCLLVQHEGNSIAYVSEREKRALNREMVEQPAISNYFSPFETASHRYLNYPGLKKLFIEESTYSTDALKQLIAPSKYLTSINLHHLTGPLPFKERDLCQVLSLAAGTLKVLKLFWTYHPLERDYGFDLSQFTALRLLRIEPGLLLGPHKSLETYTSTESPDLAQLIRSRLPPNLKMLLLESLTLPDRIDPELEQVIFGKDLEFMRCLLEQRDSIAPRLTYLLMYYLNNMVPPKDLYKLADRVGMRFCGLYDLDDLDPDWDWLDKDEG